MSGVRYAADGLPAGVKMPSTASSRSGCVFSTMCTSRGVIRKARAVLERLDLVAEVVAARAAPDPDDLVVEVVVPRRLARRHVADEHRRASRAVVRAEEDLERAAAGRLAGLDGVDRDDVVARAHRRVEVGLAAERDADERRCPPHRRRARPPRPRAGAPPSRMRERAPSSSPAPANANSSTS